MDNLENDLLNSNINLIISNIYLTEKEIERDIFKLEKKITFETIPHILDLCEKIKEEVLYFEDEQILSKIQNDCRRINIASKLMFGLCFLYENSIEYECSSIVYEMLDVHKLKKISEKINRKNLYALKQEKYLFRMAEKKLIKNVEGDTSFDSDRININQNEDQSHEKDMENLEPQAQLSFLHDTEIATQIRDVSHESSIHIDTINQFQQNDDTNLILEASIREIQNQLLEDMRQISEILENGSATIAEMPEMPEVPEKTLEITQKSPSVHEKDQDKVADGETGSILLEENDLKKEEAMEEDQWSLTYIEPTRPKLKKQHKPLAIDKNTVIPNYAARALHLNRNMNVERVQVYEGPPSILRSISLSHIMTNPSFRASIRPERRSSRLNSMYERHLITEKKPFEPRRSPKRHFTEAFQTNQLLQPQKSFEEEMDKIMMAGVPEPHAKEALTEISTEPNVHEESNQGIASFVADLEKESFIGQPLSRIVQPVFPSPEAEHMNTYVSQTNGRVQQLRGRSQTPLISFWTYSAEKNPPNEKWREFKFVMNKLEEFWTLSEQRDEGREINARSLLSFEKDKGAASFLTLLRILDKLSLQRKLVLKVNNGDIFVSPFKKPYVSDKAFMLKDKEPKF